MTAEFFSKMIGTLAVILMVATLIGGSELLTRYRTGQERSKYILIAGLLGGVFGIYGNLSGIQLEGAVVSVRDIGPMLAGFIGGPVGGIIAGLIAGLHRLYLGGITAKACVVATCCIGAFCGFLGNTYREQIVKPLWAFTIGFLCECFHLGLVIAMVRPLETALFIVSQIFVPFVTINALGFTIMIAIMTYIERQRTTTLEQARLQSELQLGTTIQQSALPNIDNRYPGRKEVDIAASMIAAKEVGGDFYDVFYVGDNKLAFVMADVSGKGIPAALFMMVAKQTIQGCVRDIKPLGNAIARANNSLCARNDAEMFVTAWIGVLDLATLEMTYVNAGHNPPVLIGSGEADYVRERSGLILAGMEDVPYREHTLQLHPEDALFLYTDGVTEAENIQHELLGEDRLLEGISDCHGAKAEAVLERVQELIANHVQGADQFDDITMMCVVAKQPTQSEEQ